MPPAWRHATFASFFGTIWPAEVVRPIELHALVAVRHPPPVARCGVLDPAERDLLRYWQWRRSPLTRKMAGRSEPCVSGCVLHAPRSNAAAPVALDDLAWYQIRSRF
jgi:hypothetical protein